MLVGNFDPAAGVIDGAAPVPEPRSFALLGAARLGLGICGGRKLLLR